ncbi:hypothetical protein KCP70_20135 [Salmonella enterica subsp. enterica]|nr:hypothetical protein KCP70_20135 [Salmonella enterica subsp. enterica]
MALGLAGAAENHFKCNPLATPPSAYRPRRFCAALKRLCWGRYSGIPAARFIPGQCVHLLRFNRAYPGRYYPLDRRRRIRVVLFGIALVFTFNALGRHYAVSWLMKIRCRGWYSDDGEPGPCASWESTSARPVLGCQCAFVRYGARKSRHLRFGREAIGLQLASAVYAFRGCPLVAYR